MFVTDEAHPREQLSPMPLHLGHHPPSDGPNSRHDTRSRRIGSPDVSAASPQVVSAVERSQVLQHFDMLVHSVWRRRLAVPQGTHRCPAWRMRRRRESTGAGPVAPYRDRYRTQWTSRHLCCAMYVPRAQHRSLAVTELVEHEQRVIARAPNSDPLYDAPSCSPCTGLSGLSMSKITRRCGVRDIAPSTHLAFSRSRPFHVCRLG